MLDPKQGWFTSTFWTLKKRASRLMWEAPTLAGAGVSPRILLQAFRSAGYVWYSRVYGYNKVLIGVDRQTAALCTNVPYSNQGPIAFLLEQDDFVLEEYILTRGVLAQFGIAVPDDPTVDDWADLWEDDPTDAYRWLKPAVTLLFDRPDPRIRSLLEWHDDCFFSAAQVNLFLLRDLIVNVLRMHSYYFGSIVDWSNTSDYIVAQLIGSRSLLLRSDVERSQLELLIEPKSEGSWLHRLFQPRRLTQHIAIEGGRAILPPPYGI